jgi:hypothetical protein
MSSPTMTGRNAETATDGSGSPTREWPGNSPSGGGSSLERVTVNLTSKSISALERITAATGETKTDSINKALQVYSFIRQVMQADGRLYVRDSPDGETERLHIF